MLKIHFYLFGAIALIWAVASWAGVEEKINYFKIVDSMSAKKVQLASPVGLMNNSIGIEPSSRSSYNLVIDKSSLGKEFLLQGQLITQPVVPSYGGLKSRVVSFKKAHNKLFMLEASKGHQVSDEIDQKLLLSSFPIVSESDRSIEFDFNAGMSKLFVASDWTGQDSDGSEYRPDFTSMEIKESYIESYRVVDELNLIEVVQVALMDKPAFGYNMNQPIKAKYYLQLYQPDLTYKPLISKNFDRFGFFEVAPFIREDGHTFSFATRFHPENEITFAISANTPEDFFDAVKDGILYWNTAFEGNPIKVIRAPEGVSAPDPSYNVVQWVNWDSAGFAYADAQMDPRTGQTLHAQVFMTSVFAISGKKRARRVLELLKQSKISHITLKGFVKEQLCDRKAEADFSNHLTQLVLDESQSDASILKMSQDYVREVIAHEVGHTLGLRHNFAGSLGANYALKDRDDLVKSYLKDKKSADGKVYSSSVMEYQVFEESAMTGDLIHQAAIAMPYDRAAIGALYYNKEYQFSELPLFCTDSHTGGTFQDCKRFDLGASPIENHVFFREQNIKIMGHSLAYQFIQAKNPSVEDLAIPIEQVAINLNGFIDNMLEGLVFVQKSLSDKVQLIRTSRQFPVVDDSNRKLIEQQATGFVDSELGRMGGLSSVLLMDEDGIASKIKSVFLETIEIAQRYVEHPLTDVEIQIANQKVDALLANFGTKFLMSQVVAIGEMHKIGNLSEKFIYRYEDVISDMVEKIVFGITNETESVKVELKNGSETVLVDAKLPVFAFSFDVRQKVAKFFSDNSKQAIDFGVVYKARYKKKMDDQIKRAFSGIDPSKTPIESFPRKVVRWLSENEDIKDKF